MGHELREVPYRCSGREGCYFQLPFSLGKIKRSTHVYVYSCVNHRMMELEVEVRGQRRLSGLGSLCKRLDLMPSSPSPAIFLLFLPYLCSLRLRSLSILPHFT